MKNAVTKLLLRLEKLLEIKSIITLTLLYIFANLVKLGVIDGVQFSGVFHLVIGFYFGSQVEKNKDRQ